MISYNEIIAELERNWEALESSLYPEDLVREWAESEVPIYNSDIYSEWGSLPRDAQDEWAGVGFEFSSETTILELMRMDLFLYIDGQYSRAYADLLASKEERN